ncbi:hypothetical protein BpHYR1_049920 [Brachionus plicatilis]|uniref:Peptidase A2 domain-containing protein n=1 Tax=Brachionus plicatilis TaxID=10195 RepID=A0A3M7S618_BRAPC|nr:hypothetical protein BpHYR1_049920 [Brachionus plicatilis]
MQFGNEGIYKTLYSEARNSHAIKAPNELKEGMDCRNEPIKGFDSFKRQLCDKFTNTVKFKSTVNWDQLSDLKQSPRESIVDYGEKVTQLVKQKFPKTETSDDIDRLIQDRFVEGLYNQRLREKVRAKMLKMRQIETEKVYKIQDLINYADCKMSSFDKQPFYYSTTSESDALQNRRYAIQPNLKQTFGGNFKSNSYPYNNPREPNNQRQDKAFSPHQSTQKQVKFEDKGNSEPLHVINAVNLRKRPNRERPVIGVAIFNNTLVNYLCDSGADRTIINTKTFNLLKRHAPGTELEIHSGSELFSCSGPIKILGKVKLSRCIVSREEILKNVEILVTETVSNNDCLLGRDLINKLKHIGPRFEHIKTMVKTMSDEVRRIFREEMREKRCKKTIKSCTYHNVKEEEVVSITNFDEVHPENNFGKGVGEVPKPKVCGTVIETEIVAELKVTSLSKDDLNMEAVKNARAFLKNKIEEVSAKSVLDLKPEKNSDVAFEIEFQDPNQKPIKCRCRPLPWNLKEKVNSELDRQLKAGIIRPKWDQLSSGHCNGCSGYIEQEIIKSFIRKKCSSRIRNSVVGKCDIQSGSEQSIDDATQNTNSSSNSESEITNADRIAQNPSSSIENEFESLKEEQEKDEDIQ